MLHMSCYNFSHKPEPRCMLQTRGLLHNTTAHSWQLLFVLARDVSLCFSCSSCMLQTLWSLTIQFRLVACNGHTQPVSELSRGCKQAAPNTELRRAPILGSKQAVTRQALLLVSLFYRHAGSQPIVTSAVTGGCCSVWSTVVAHSQQAWHRLCS